MRSLIVSGTQNFISLIQATVPGALTRSLSDKYLLGKYVTKKMPNENNNFLIFQTSDYSLSYAAMLDWEKTMLKDLFILFNINITDLNNPIFGQLWKDLIINNKDVRVLYGENGEVVGRQVGVAPKKTYTDAIDVLL